VAVEFSIFLTEISLLNIQRGANGQSSQANFFLDIFHRHNFYKTQRFGDWNLSPSSGIAPTQLGQIDRANPDNRYQPTNQPKI
jgi:hypothetical protein